MNRNALKNYSDAQVLAMAATARLFRNHGVPGQKPLPLRFSVALAMVEKGVVSK